MEFTYKAYENLLELLRENGYSFRGYHDFEHSTRCVILRHDIDTDISKALLLAELEKTLGVSSTYFVLLKTDFYNVASSKSLKQLQRILQLGHEIGLHFDEASYDDGLIASNEVQKLIIRESNILSDILETPITTVSMHRPSKATLEADLEIPGLINSYGKKFFHEFKYLSDSRRRWREPVLDIIKSGEYDRLHILTHAFWYQDNDEPINVTIKKFISSANKERYDCMKDNITNLSEILKWEDV